ncbi:MAG: S-adenosyl-l-methionine hydroxide adenosyltransferase family protein [Syntrophobacteria bacterium]
MQRTVTLLTDFGTRDHYVAVVKGVLLSINPHLTLVDITHEVSPQNIPEAGFLLASAFRYFPENTVHLAVVDPGVGGERQGLAAATEHYLFVGPDNGLLDRVFTLEPPSLVVSLENPQYQLPRPSPTFHARDIFAPAAAHLSLGLPLEKLGPCISYRFRSPGRLVLTDQAQLQGEIIHIDRFGNLASNIEISLKSQNLLESLDVYLAGQQVLTGPRTYEQAPPLRLFALRGSSGYLEIAVRNGSAHETTGQGVGALVRVCRKR